MKKLLFIILALICGFSIIHSLNKDKIFVNEIEGEFVISTTETFRPKLTRFDFITNIYEMFAVFIEDLNQNIYTVNEKEIKQIASFNYNSCNNECIVDTPNGEVIYGSEQFNMLEDKKLISFGKDTENSSTIYFVDDSGFIKEENLAFSIVTSNPDRNKINFVDSVNKASYTLDVYYNIESSLFYDQSEGYIYLVVYDLVDTNQYLLRLKKENEQYKVDESFKKFIDKTKQINVRNTYIDTLNKKIYVQNDMNDKIGISKYNFDSPTEKVLFTQSDELLDNGRSSTDSMYLKDGKLNYIFYEHYLPEESTQATIISVDLVTDEITKKVIKLGNSNLAYNSEFHNSLIVEEDGILYRFSYSGKNIFEIYEYSNDFNDEKLILKARINDLNWQDAFVNGTNLG